METPSEVPPRRRRPRLVPLEWARRVRDRQHAQGVYVLPSLFTAASLACGFVAILAAAEGRWERAYLAIAVAMIADVLDGAIARLAGATGRFGIELDSLADVIAFGVAPAALIYYRFGLGRNWVVPALFAVAGALRLARFSAGVALKERDHFSGLPIPAAAGMCVALVATANEYAADPPRVAVIAFLVAVSYLMVSTFPYPSVRILERPKPFRVLAVLIFLAALLGTYPVETWAGGLLIYAASGPAIWAARRLRPRAAPPAEA